MCFKQAQRYSVHRDIAFVGLEHDNPFFFCGFISVYSSCSVGRNSTKKVTLDTSDRCRSPYHEC